MVYALVVELARVDIETIRGELHLRVILGAAVELLGRELDTVEFGIGTALVESYVISALCLIASGVVMETRLHLMTSVVFARSRYYLPGLEQRPKQLPTSLPLLSLSQ
jgi:hypothetical protein